MVRRAAHACICALGAAPGGAGRHTHQRATAACQVGLLLCALHAQPSSLQLIFTA